ncbi:hypothetical protein ACQKP8_03300 [Photobacterium alginatilyticum]|uniref:hypothetical protein n=1 Tax=Photobacterium alginatilyticum TaxID=1775171 RepID=UPI004067B5C6
MIEFFMIGFCSFSCIVIIHHIKGLEPWRIKSLFGGIAMLLISTIAVSFLLELQSLNNMLSSLNIRLFDDENNRIQIWLFMFPAIVGGIGINVVTSWIQSSKPPREE